eukprot:TRINITY_DN49890_c0_g1_i1.p1 TRINITY_DN49890_c0_g1~~TRINITY_DN49890_c0_g1_i1.p1  ORF type:complete len:344 (+),score=34.53 TRINITY_DN49890_c0_g1_i1:83-1114(+)
MSLPSDNFKALVTQEPQSGHPPTTQNVATEASSSTKSPQSHVSRFLCCLWNTKHRTEPEEVEQDETHMQSDDELIVIQQAPAPSAPVSGPSTSTVMPSVPVSEPSPSTALPPAPESETANAAGQSHAMPASSQAPTAANTGRPKSKPRQLQRYLLPMQSSEHAGRKTLVLDLDETLVHSSFSPVPCEIVLTLTLGADQHKVYVKKRPGVDEFLDIVSKRYEVVVFTASTPLYANALLDKLDTGQNIHHRLFREDCTRYREGHVKDLARLGRNLDGVIIIDNLPICYALQPDNAIPIKTWRDDPDDTELYDLVPILIALARVNRIPEVLQGILYDEGESEQGEG